MPAFNADIEIVSVGVEIARPIDRREALRETIAAVRGARGGRHIDAR